MDFCLHPNVYREIFSSDSLGIMAPVICYYSSVDKTTSVRTERPRIAFRFSRGNRDLTYIQIIRTGSAAYPHSCWTETGKKRPQPEACYLSSFSAEVEIKLNCTSLSYNFSTRIQKIFVVLAARYINTRRIYSIEGLWKRVVCQSVCLSVSETWNYIKKNTKKLKCNCRAGWYSNELRE